MKDDGEMADKLYDMNSTPGEHGDVADVQGMRERSAPRYVRPYLPGERVRILRTGCSPVDRYAGKLGTFTSYYGWDDELARVRIDGVVYGFDPTRNRAGEAYLYHDEFERVHDDL